MISSGDDQVRADCGMSGGVPCMSHQRAGGSTIADIPLWYNNPFTGHGNDLVRLEGYVYKMKDSHQSDVFLYVLFEEKGCCIEG